MHGKRSILFSARHLLSPCSHLSTSAARETNSEYAAARACKHTARRPLTLDLPVGVVWCSGLLWLKPYLRLKLKTVLSTQLEADISHIPTLGRKIDAMRNTAVFTLLSFSFSLLTTHCTSAQANTGTLALLAKHLWDITPLLDILFSYSQTSPYLKGCFHTDTFPRDCGKVASARVNVTAAL